MKLLSILVLALPLCAQVPLPDLPDETVVATFDDGVRMTMGDFKRLFAVIPVENQQQALQNRPAFLKQWAHMRKLAKLAEADQLDKLSPSKDAIEYYRVLILSQAKANAALTQVTVLPSDVRADYETNKDRYKQVRVKAIYIGFDGKKLTQDGAQAKAAKLLAQLRAGADFSKLAKESSDDETSRVKGGDFATFTLSDNMPDAVRDAVFRLAQGEVTEPVRQANGLYLFRAEEISYRPFAEVRDYIFTELKQKRYSEWLSKTNGDAIVIFNNPAFLGAIQGDPRPKK